MNEDASHRRSAVGESPGGKLMGWPGITAVTVYLVLVTVVVIHGLVVLWPPDREPAEDRVAALEGARAGAQGRAGDAACGEREDEADFLAWSVCLYPEERLFLIVMLAGALGGLVHALRSFYWYLGNRKLVTSWIGMYITLPVVGAAMAVIFYLVIRGGFTPSDSNFDRTNPFGFAAMAVLVGMFTEQASLRLKEVAETIFAKGRTGKDHAGPPALVGVAPVEGPRAGGTEVTLTGTGFEPGVQVRFAGRAATEVRVVDGASITAKTPEAAEAGAVTVEVANPGGQTVSLPGAFTYR